MLIEVLRTPLDGWLVFLAEGWQLANPLEVWHAYQGADGGYNVRMWRDARLSAA